MEPNEQSRLLSSNPESQETEHSHASNGESSRSSINVFPRRALMLCTVATLVIILLEASSMLQFIPLNQILEENLCHQLGVLPDLQQSSNGTDCSSNEAVQAELALLRGWQNTLDILPGILTAIPYGFVADKYGRKPVLAACILGMTLTSCFYAIVCAWPQVFPARLTLLSSTFLFFGGGPAVLSSLVFSILSDLSPDAYRSTTFFGLGAALLLSELFISPLISFLMQFNIWLPIVIGLSLNIPNLFIAILFPETLKQKLSPEEVPPDLATTSSDDEVTEDTGSGEHAGSDHHHFWSRVSKSLSNLRTAAVFVIWGDWQVAALMATLVTTTLGKMAQEILLQFARRRFGWPWSMTAYLVSLKAALALTLLIAILPATNYFLTSRLSMRPQSKDLLLARFSCIFLLAGNLIIGLSSTEALMILGVVVWCLGSAYNMVLRSLLAQLVEPHHRGTLFTTMAVLENMGVAIAGPLLALMFRIGLGWGEQWIGMPFLVAAMLLVLTLGPLCLVRLSNVDDSERD